MSGAKIFFFFIKNTGDKEGNNFTRKLDQETTTMPFELPFFRPKLGLRADVVVSATEPVAETAERETIISSLQDENQQLRDERDKTREEREKIQKERDTLCNKLSHENSELKMANIELTATALQQADEIKKLTLALEREKERNHELMDHIHESDQIMAHHSQKEKEVFLIHSDLVYMDCNDCLCLDLCLYFGFWLSFLFCPCLIPRLSFTHSVTHSLSVCLSICLSVCPSICMSVGLSVSLSPIKNQP